MGKPASGLLLFVAAFEGRCMGRWSAREALLRHERPGWSGSENKKEEIMESIRFPFTCAAGLIFGSRTYALLIFAIAIIDDGKKRDQERKQRRDKSARQQSPKAKPVSLRPL